MIERDRGYARLQDLIEHLKFRDVRVSIGVLDGSGGEIDIEDGGLTMAGLAAVHEFGLDNIPERAPIRKTLDAQEQNIQRAATRLLTRVVEGEETVDKALGKLGQLVSSQIRRAIQRGVDPPNAPATIRRNTRASRPC